MSTNSSSSGRRMAYVAVVEGPPARKVAGNYLGIAVYGELGYHPVPAGFWLNHNDAQAEADRLNRRLGLTPHEAVEIILSTMGKAAAGPKRS